MDLRTHLARTLGALEPAGLDGLLIVQNRKQPGPLAVAAAMLAAGTSLEPLVALSPAYVHPVTACLEVVALSAAFGRPIGMNLVAGPPAPGGTRPDYRRFAEFTDIVRRLLAGEVVSTDSAHYRVDRAALAFATAAERRRVWAVVAGSSDEACELSRTQGLHRVAHLTDPAAEVTWATHTGIICRPDTAEAWAAARQAFPPPDGTAAAPAGSAWSARITATAGTDPLYFADPFRAGARPFPYLVGSDADVAARVRRLAAGGCRMLVLQRTDEPANLARAAAVLAG